MSMKHYQEMNIFKEECVNKAGVKGYDCSMIWEDFEKALEHEGITLTDSETLRTQLYLFAMITEYSLLEVSQRLDINKNTITHFCSKYIYKPVKNMLITKGIEDISENTRIEWLEFHRYFEKLPVYMKAEINSIYENRIGEINFGTTPEIDGITTIDELEARCVEYLSTILNFGATINSISLEEEERLLRITLIIRQALEALSKRYQENTR